MEILKLRLGANSYNTSEVEILARLEEDQIFDLFMSFKGEELTGYIRAFMLLAGSNKDLSQRTGRVLERIAEISPLNRSRLAKFRR
ncbi:hypothetical protein [Aliamphritea spongicola]|nr:hypothetical protein [Aliamphritea spongicola]